MTRPIILGILFLALVTVGCGEPDPNAPAKVNPRNRQASGPQEDLPVRKINLQRLVNEAADGTVVEIPSGRYLLSSPLTLARRKNLHLAFHPGTQVRLADVNADIIVIDDCRNIRITGVHARHLKPLKEYQCHGSVLRINNSRNVRIENCELNGCGAVGVMAKQSSLSIFNCHIHHNTWNAIYLYSCPEAVVVGNLIEDNANTLQASGQNGEIDFSDNLVRRNGGYWRKPRKPGLLPTTQPDLRPVTDGQTPAGRGE
jgi:hypothetical protein